MNFGEIIKNEIIKRPLKDDGQKLAFLSGILRGNGVLCEKDGQTCLEFTIKNEQTLSVVSACLESLFRYELREVCVGEDRLNNNERYSVTISGESAVDILSELGIFTEKDGVLSVNFDMYSPNIIKNEELLKAFIRGLFITAGGCTIPNTAERTNKKQRENNTGYHLELVFMHTRPAQATADKLLACGIKTKITRRKESYVVYIKSAEEIKDFIAFLPAPVSVLKLTDTMIERELKNNSNRQKNCDLGNVNRQVEASAKQILAVEKIEKERGLNTLPQDLISVALARKDNPEDTLCELAERLNLTKSCINHRMRKIVEISQKL